MTQIVIKFNTTVSIQRDGTCFMSGYAATLVLWKKQSLK